MAEASLHNKIDHVDSKENEIINYCLCFVLQRDQHVDNRKIIIGLKRKSVRHALYAKPVFGNFCVNLTRSVESEIFRFCVSISDINVYFILYYYITIFFVS